MKNLIVLPLLCILLCGCGESDQQLDTIPTPAPVVAARVEQVIEEVLPAFVTDSTCDIKIEDSCYTLPVSMQDMISDGWEFAIDSNEELNDRDNWIGASRGDTSIICVTDSLNAEIGTVYEIYAFSDSGLDGKASIGDVILGEAPTNSVPHDSSRLYKISLSADKTYVNTIGVRLKAETPKSPKVDWNKSMSITVDGINLSFPSDAQTVINSGIMSVSRHDGVTDVTEEGSDVLIRLYTNGLAYTGVSIKERNVSTNLYCYGIDFMSTTGDVIDVFGDDYYSYYDVNGRTYMTFEMEDCYCAFVFNGSRVNEVHMFTNEEDLKHISEVK